MSFEEPTLLDVANVLRDIAGYSDDAAQPYGEDELISLARWLEDNHLELEPLAVGWAMPERAYYKGSEWHRNEKMDYYCGDYVRVYERQIRVYLDRAPRGSRPVAITGREVGT